MRWIMALALIANLAIVNAVHAAGEGVQDSAAIANAATDAYQRGDFAAAVTNYERARANGLDNGAVRYNLGNAYFRLNRIGAAIGAYRLALVELPTSVEIRENLDLARKRVSEPVLDTTERGIRLSPAQLRLLTMGLSRAQLKQAMLLTYALFWLLVCIRYWRSGRALRSLSVVSAVSFLWLTAGYLCIRLDIRGEPTLALPGSNQSFGVVVAPKVEVYAGDSETFQVVALLHEGAELRLGERRGLWQEVLLPNGRKGWSKRELLTEIVS